MEEVCTENIIKELDNQIQGKQAWLKSSREILNELCTEIANISTYTESLFVSFDRTSEYIVKLSGLFTVPAFVLQFAEGLKSISDYSLSAKLKDISIRIEDWTESLCDSMNILEKREHCKTLYNKIITETSKITQDYRIIEMDSIKDDFWASFLYKHKEFLSSLATIKESVPINLIGSISELVSNVSEFLIKYSKSLDPITPISKSYIYELEKTLKYPISLYYNQIRLQKYPNVNDALRVARARVFESNCVVKADYIAVHPNELSIRIGDPLELRKPKNAESWYKAINLNGEMGYIPFTCASPYKYSIILNEIQGYYDINSMIITDIIDAIKKAENIIKQTISSIKSHKVTPITNKKLPKLENKLHELIIANKLLLNELKENIQHGLLDYTIYLVLYIDIYHTIQSIISIIPHQTKVSLNLGELIDEIVVFI